MHIYTYITMQYSITIEVIIIDKIILPYITHVVSLDRAPTLRKSGSSCKHFTWLVHYLRTLLTEEG